jgi:hypothetical protein
MLKFAPTYNLFIITPWRLGGKSHCRFIPVVHLTLFFHLADVTRQASHNTMLPEAILDPTHTAIHIALMLAACALLSKTWVDVSGSGPRDIAKQPIVRHLNHLSCPPSFVS